MPKKLSLFRLYLIGIFDTNLVTEAISNDVPSISTRPLLKPEQAVTEADFEVKSGKYR